MLLDGVHLVGAGVAPLAGQRFLGVVGGRGAGAGDVYVAAAEVAAGLQAGGHQALPAGRHEARRQQVLVLLQNDEGSPFHWQEESFITEGLLKSTPGEG